MSISHLQHADEGFLRVWKPQAFVGCLSSKQQIRRITNNYMQILSLENCASRSGKSVSLAENRPHGRSYRALTLIVRK
jgi:hypothetical protein